MAFYLAYGNLMWEFSTFTSALESTLLMTLGNYDFESMIYKQPLVGQLLFWLYMLMGFFVCHWAIAKSPFVSLFGVV